jgi:DNA-binding MarR family transcriptional regulator
MQLLRIESNRPVVDDVCAREVLDAVPLVMAVIRGQMRKHRSGLTVPQFRTLYFVSTATGRSLSDVADFIGLSLPAMSRMVDGLVEKRLMVRRTCDDDRRHIRLSLTPLGESTLHEARQLAQAHLADLMRPMTDDQRTKVIEMMHLLRGVFAPDLPATAAAGREQDPAGIAG